MKAICNPEYKALSAHMMENCLIFSKDDNDCKNPNYLYVKALLHLRKVRISRVFWSDHLQQTIQNGKSTITSAKKC